MVTTVSTNPTLPTNFTIAVTVLYLTDSRRSDWAAEPHMSSAVKARKAPPLKKESVKKNNYQ